MEKYLMHYRTKGSKNGQRLYQREDGSWTSIGLDRRRAQYNGTGRKIAKGVAAGAAGASAAANIASAVALGRKGKLDSKDYAKALESGNRATEKMSDAYRSLDSTDKRLSGGKKYDFSKLSDGDLKRITNRLKMEQDLNYYLNKENEEAKVGREWVSDALSIAGGVAAIGASAATIYYMMRKAG